MKKLFVIKFMVLFLLAGCGQQQGADDQDSMKVGSELSDPQARAFLNQLHALCGQSFSGEETFIAEGRESWADKEFLMQVTVCEDGRVYIPFHLDDDTSRTWMFLVEDGKLRFRHDHRHEDGTPEDVTMYGGYATENGSAMQQDFPADAYTCELLPTACKALWRVSLSSSPKSLTYSLFDDGELLFAATFDLDNPL